MAVSPMVALCEIKTSPDNRESLSETISPFFREVEIASREIDHAAFQVRSHDERDAFWNEVRHLRF